MALVAREFIKPHETDPRVVEHASIKLAKSFLTNGATEHNTMERNLLHNIPHKIHLRKRESSFLNASAISIAHSCIATLI